jgi:hypothetical protein
VKIGIPSESPKHLVAAEPEGRNAQAQLAFFDAWLLALHPRRGKLQDHFVQLFDAPELLGRIHSAVPIQQHAQDGRMGVVETEGHGQSVAPEPTVTKSAQD